MASDPKVSIVRQGQPPSATLLSSHTSSCIGVDTRTLTDPSSGINDTRRTSGKFASSRKTKDRENSYFVRVLLSL